MSSSCAGGDLVWICWRALSLSNSDRGEGQPEFGARGREYGPNPRRGEPRSWQMTAKGGRETASDSNSGVKSVGEREGGEMRYFQLSLFSVFFFNSIIWIRIFSSFYGYFPLKSTKHASHVIIPWVFLTESDGKDWNDQENRSLWSSRPNKIK